LLWGELVIQSLKETGDNQVHAAKLLGITRATLRSGSINSGFSGVERQISREALL
jgi:DNA-binding protein Fis